MKRTVTTLVLGIAMLGSACYRATIETGLQPNGTMIQQKWAMSFVSGLVPPPTVETASKCPDGVAKVETYHSFLNSLVAAVTWGIVTPMTIEVSCAAKRTSDAGGSTLNVADGQSVRAAVGIAAEQAVRTGEAVYLTF